MAALASRHIRFRPSREEKGSETLGGAARPDTVQPADEISLPRFDARALARRAALPAAVVAVAAVALLVAGGPLRAFAHALRRAFDADPRWVAGAVAFEVLSFTGYVALLWLVAGRASARLGLRESAQITLGGAAATRLLPTAGVGGAALTLWALRRSGLAARDATRTLLTFLVLLYAIFLLSIAGAGGALALGLVHADGPLALSAVPAAAAVAAMALAVTLGIVGPMAAADGRLRRGAAAMGAAMRGALRVALSGDPRLLGALAWWGFDAAVLWAMLHAFGAPPALTVVIFAYFVGQVGNTIPIPGAVSGGMVGVLAAFGVHADLALASVLAYRSIAIWVPAPVGLAALGGLRRTIASWSAAAPAPTAPASPAAAAAAKTPRAPLPRPVPA